MSESHIFVCYSHRDASEVTDEVRHLRGQGFLVWYDDQIEAGTAWRDELANAISSARALVYFVTPSSSTSENCVRELDYAMDRGVPTLAVHLRPTSLPPGLAFRLGSRQGLMKYDLGLDETRRRVLDFVRSTRSLAPTDHRVAAESPRLSEPDDRINVVVARRLKRSNPATEDLTEVVLRYISLYGGPFRALTIGHDERCPDNAMLVRLAAAKTRDRMSVSWEMTRGEPREVLWSGKHAESPSDFAMKRGRIGDMIAYGLIRRAIAEKVHRATRLADRHLRYWDLLLMAEPFSGMQEDRRKERHDLIQRAVAMFPYEAFGYAVRANVLSWEAANGVSRQPDADRANARQSASTAVEREPNDAFVLMLAGTTFCRLNEYDRGVALSRRAYALAGSVESKDRLAMSLCFAGTPDEAIQLYLEILETMPAGQTFQYARLAIAMVQAGRIADALQSSTDSVIHYPDDYFGWLVHANVLAQLDRIDDAHDALTNSMSLMPRLRLAAAIEGIEATYGRNADQRRWLTAGLRRLVSR